MVDHVRPSGKALLLQWM